MRKKVLECDYYLFKNNYSDEWQKYFSKNDNIKKLIKDFQKFLKNTYSNKPQIKSFALSEECILDKSWLSFVLQFALKLNAHCIKLIDDTFLMKNTTTLDD